MVETVLDFILDFIRIDLIIGFGWYSILFFILRLFKRQKEFLAEFDKNACGLVVLLGILFFMVWLSLVAFNYFGIMTNEERTVFIQRLTGPYGFAFFFQPLFWLILTQLLRIRWVRRFLIFRILIVIPFFITFERFVIIVTSLHRDYLPFSWQLYTSLGYTFWDFLAGIILKIIVFSIVVFAYMYVKKWLLQYKTAKTT